MMGMQAKKALRMTRAGRLITGFRQDDSGATAIEYGLIVSLIFLAIIASVKSFGNSSNEMYTEIESEITSVIE